MKYDELKNALRNLEKQSKNGDNQTKEVKKQLEDILNDEQEKMLRFIKTEFLWTRLRVNKMFV